MSATSPSASPIAPFAIGFESTPSSADYPPLMSALTLPMRWLGGQRSESLFPSALPRAHAHGFTLFQQGPLILGCTTQPINGDPAAAAQELYRRLFVATSGHHLYRIWNYVPAINAEQHGLENYRAFCSGRARAFATAHGENFELRLPAASAVGCHGSHLSLVFVAGPTAPQHFENPQQVSAYRYPREHGPHSPSFARATLAQNGDQALVFISGTAAIKGHTSIAPGQIREQLDCTFDNLRLIGRTAGVGDDLGRDQSWERHFKVYLRHPHDLAYVKTRFESELASPTDRVTYLESDICRAELDVEIEATLLAAR